MARKHVIEGQQLITKPNVKVGDLTLVIDHTSKCGIPHLLSISQKSQNLALLTFLTIVLTLYAFLTYMGQQNEQLIALIHLLWRLVDRVLNTYTTSSLRHTIDTGINYLVGS